MRNEDNDWCDWLQETSPGELVLVADSDGDLVFRATVVDGEVKEWDWL